MSQLLSKLPRFTYNGQKAQISINCTDRHGKLHIAPHVHHFSPFAPPLLHVFSFYIAPVNLVTGGSPIFHLKHRPIQYNSIGLCFKLFYDIHIFLIMFKIV